MPVWVPLACYSAIALGTMSGGWKIVKTMGTRITKVTPFEGVAAETAGAITLFVTEALENSGKYYAYDYRFHYRCWCYQAFICRTLGRYRKPSLGVDSHHPGKRGTGCPGLFYRQLVYVENQHPFIFFLN